MQGGRDDFAALLEIYSWLLAVIGLAVRDAETAQLVSGDARVDPAQEEMRTFASQSLDLDAEANAATQDGTISVLA